MSPGPTLEQVDQLPRHLSLVVPDGFQDANGHVGIKRHYEFHLAATERAMTGFGLGFDLVEKFGLGVFTAEQHLTFLSEVLVGDEISAHLRVLGASLRSAHCVSILMNRTSGQVANLFEFTEVHVDLKTRSATPFRTDTARTLDALVTEHAALDWSVPLGGPLSAGRR